jgi:Asp/Glu/hydantoin racemase
MRLLFLNPNTSAHLTELGAQLARQVARPETEIVPVTGQFGARYISSRAAAAIAQHAALDAFAPHRHRVDVVLLACFGDPGLFALREVAQVPVVGMAEASCQLAASGGRKFSIVTGGHRWGPMLREFVAVLGLASQLASVRTMAPSGAEIAADPAGALAALAAACRAAAEEDGAAVVILGGLGLAGLADRIAERVSVPLIDSVVAAVAVAEAAPSHAAAGKGSLAPAEPTESTALSASLAALLAGDRG